MNTTNPKKIREGYQPIPGYTLEEIIGRGGFGEVWRADAPGGLKKAVKFVFGAHDQSRASRELRSLERIRGVQHPFLLTLERFEIVDDQLVIVTELADGSLEDVFRRSCENGSCGIPRATLISHLNDAADALDYLHQSYQLQHLDIKPGNLLMMGGHVKVADFGLLKDLTEADCSVVGGLTPIYAPPEVFDGRPSMHSDQYSLAVMYQELLTGTRPFSGRTIAQLATQHVHSAPNLESLPPSDRPVAARALEKNPARRFPNCKDFVEALRSARNRGTVITGSGEQLVAAETDHEVPVGQPIEDLPQLNRNSAADLRVTNHAMVVGLGGTGADCLRELRSRVADLHSACPLDLHAVLIDTDIATIHAMRVAEVSDRTPACQTIHIPLRSAHEYRENGTDRLKSISRRWIYNVPRTRSTEGMRPLGRLALVDHGPHVTNALKQAIERLSQSAGDVTPQVYVIGSLTGGTSSGIYLDVVHLLRQLLDDAGQQDTQILSMLATAELRADPTTPLALHDTHAALIEMQHFMCPGNGYPGDLGAGFRSVPAARTPLHDVYLVAAAPRAISAPSPAQTITDYVWSDATGGGELLAAARELGEEENESALIAPALRSVGVVALGISRSLEQKLLVPATIRHLLLRWLGLPSAARITAPTLADRLTRRCAISRQAFVEATFDFVGADQPQRRHWIGEHLKHLTDDQLSNDQSIASELLQLLRQRCTEKNADLMIESVITNLKRELSVSLHDQRIDATTAIETVKLLVEATSQATQTIRDDGDPTIDASESTRYPRDVVGPQRDTNLTNEPGVDPYDHQMQLLSDQVEKVAGERLQVLCQRLTQLQEKFESFATTLAMAILEVTKDQPTQSNPWDEMPEPIGVHFESTVVKLHELSVTRWLLKPLAESPTIACDAKRMVEKLWEAALPLVAEIVDHHIGQCNEPAASTSAGLHDASATFLPNDSISIRDTTIVTQPLVTNSPSLTRACCQEPLPVDEAVDAVRPPLLNCGGRQRMILVVGTEAEQKQLEPKVREMHPAR